MIELPPLPIDSDDRPKTNCQTHAQCLTDYSGIKKNIGPPVIYFMGAQIFYKKEELLMKNNTDINSLSLLKEICSFYDFDIAILGDPDKPEYVIDNGTTLGLSFLGAESKTTEGNFTHFEYKNLGVALKDWLGTLVASNADSAKDGSGDYNVWTKEIIDFISGLGPVYKIGSEIVANRNFPETAQNASGETSYDVKAGERLKIVAYNPKDLEYKVENSSLGFSAWFMISEADLQSLVD